ncbi:MAG: AraC family transcriptional regulator [Pseudomonadota bacterium]
MELIDLFEGILRGGAGALCIVLIAQILAPRPITWPAIYGSLFLLGAGIYSIAVLPALLPHLGWFKVPLKAIGIASPGFFWLFVRALNDDNYRFSWVDLLAPAILTGLYLLCTPFPALKSYTLWINLALVSALMAHTIYIVRCCLADDLVASRRQVARTMSWLIPLIALAIFAVELVEIAAEAMKPAGAPIWMRASAAIGMLTVGVILMTSLSSIRKTLLPVSANSANERSDVSGSAAGLSAADRIDLGRIRDLMEDGAYLSPGLSIGELAQQLNLPEHRLRKLINGALGYRNFAAFVNDYRIAEAKRRLAMPDFVHTQITSLAYDLGYGSLAPFNRAFRERAGLSPSEFREQVLSPPQ